MRKSVAIQTLLLLPLLICHAFADPEASVAPMEKTEQEALYSVIRGFVGSWWNGSELYPDPCGWTPIQGVSCDLFNGSWYVTVLDIGSILENSLVCAQDAKFSPSLFEFKHLRSLTFFNCFSQPTAIPCSNWEKLAVSLDTLEFRSNRGLIGKLPASLSRLTSLQSLVLVENSLTGELPPELGNVAPLKRLVLAGNRFSGQIPASLGNRLTQLLILDLSRNSLTGSLPSSLGSITSLLKLDLSDNLLDGNIPGELGKLSNLTLLDLRNNNFSGGLAQSLQGMVSLQDLLLSNNPLGGNLMGFGWDSLTNLTTLNLSNLSLTGSIPESISALKRLRFLALDNNRLSGSVPPKLAALPSLSALYINGNNLTGAIEFSEEFYVRMGRRFASWGNPSLCYNSVIKEAGHAPVGVEQCKHGQNSSNHNPTSGHEVDIGHPDQNLAAPVPFSTSCDKGYWWVFIVQEVNALLLLAWLL